jgi:hypothetical protein
MEVNAPEWLGGLYNAFTTALGTVELPPVVITLLTGLGHGSVAQLPAYLRPLAHVLLSRVSYATQEQYYAALRQAVTKVERAAAPTTRAVLPPTQTLGATKSFPGFVEKRHIALVGTTNAGKTSWVITTLLKPNGFAPFDVFYFVASPITEASKLQQMKKAVDFNMRIINKKEVTRNEFAFFKNTQFNEVKIELSNAPSSLRKLVFFDDIQASAGARDMRSVAQFVLEAKNLNCTVIVSLHSAAEANGEKTVRDGARYLVLMNQTQTAFNRLAGDNLHKDNTVYNRYAAIPGKPQHRVIIVDQDEHKRYFGLGRLAEFDPLINE